MTYTTPRDITNPYLGLRDVPPGLYDFELTTFFSFSASELGRIAARRQPLHRLAPALHIGFLRMTSRKLDVLERIPKRLWTHLGQQIGVAPPELATLRALYTTRAQTLYDHQQLACDVVGFCEMTEHQRRYVVRWLRETLPGRGGINGLLPESRRWFYEHQILLIADRELKRFIAEAVRDREAQLLQASMKAYGPERLTEWADAITGERDDGTPRQTWLWAAPRKQSTVKMSHFFEKLEFLRSLGVHEGWPDAVNDAAVRHYGRRCVTREPTASKRITSDRRALEVACFMRYALCSASDQLLLMLRR